MLAYKHITKWISAGMGAAVLLCILLMLFPGKLKEVFGSSAVSMQYETELFQKDEIIKIDIRMESEDWEDMLANAIREEYYSCDLVVNGEKIYNVGIRPKGNTSLTAIASDPDTDRFSLKLEFDHYVDGQTCFGLDKLILNNNYADATNMKEAIVYDMYQYLDTDASLYNYAEISVNGEYWGVYLALEAVEDSFLLRNYGTEDGNLYKPESMGMGSGGANLNYMDDDPDSYSVIWEGEVVDTGRADHGRVVAALKEISRGSGLEEVLDVDNVLRYMAVHVFSVNMDSLSGNMAHNYYLYEYDGKLNILPWDYNLAFGGMGMGGTDSASGMVNDAIDTPFQGTDFFDPLLENEEYCSRYHEYLRRLTEEYVDGGKFQETYSRIRSQIDELVERDPTAFYSAQEYETAAEMLYQTVLLRAESIRGQLDGRIPSTDDGQRKDSAELVDASVIDVEAMGVFEMGGGKPFSRQGRESGQEIPGEPQEGQFGDFAPPQRPDGDFGDFDWPQRPGDNFGDSGRPQEPGNPFGNQDMPSMFENAPGEEAIPTMAGRQPGNYKWQNVIVLAAFLVTATGALLLAKRYRRTRRPQSARFFIHF